MSRRAAVLSLAVAAAVLLLSLCFAKLFTLGLSPRAVSTAQLLPLGFVMGFPFPMAMRLVNAHGLGRYVSFMWGINGIASVLGSILCMMVALWTGFSWALLLGATSYVLVAGLFLGLSAPFAGSGSTPGIK